MQLVKPILEGVGDAVATAVARRQAHELDKENQQQIGELRRASLEIQREELKLLKERAERESAESAARLRSNEQQDYIRRGEFEHDRLAEQRGLAEKSQAKAQQTELDRAMEMSGAGSLIDVARQHPELIPEIEHSNQLLSRLTDPKARALYALDQSKAFAGKASALQKQQAKAKWNDAFRKQELAGSDGSPDEGFAKLRDTMLAGMDADEVTGKQAMETLEAYRQERIKDESDVEARTINTQTLKATYGPLLAQMPDMAGPILEVINGYKRGSGSYAQTIQQIGRLMSMQPKEPEAPKSTDPTPAELERLAQGAARLTGEKDIGKAGAAVRERMGMNGKAADVPYTPEELDFARQFRADHPNATPADLAAALKARKGAKAKK